ncbi:MAG TPA: hydroxymethylbilane synthase [Candidatus Binatia bacterium]|jgi:hydroxymethylbilane synthase
MNVIRIGTRGSALALAQTEWVKRKLEERYPELGIEVVTIKTSGDRFLTAPIVAIPGKGIFVKEIEEALLKKAIDLAVHSMKDLPTEMTPGLAIAAIPEREDARDVLVSSARRPLKDLPAGAKLGTGSLRRRAQILHCRPDLSVEPIRGNVDTRLRKMDAGEVDGLVMAAAGLKRLGLEKRVTEYLDEGICLGAVAQGALGLEIRGGDRRATSFLEFLRHAPTMLEVAAERAFLMRLGGGCQLPVGARAWAKYDKMRLKGVIADPDGRKLFKDETEGPAEQAEHLGRTLAERLLTMGADKILTVESRDSVHGAG